MEDETDTSQPFVHNSSWSIEQNPSQTKPQLGAQAPLSPQAPLSLFELAICGSEDALRCENGLSDFASDHYVVIGLISIVANAIIIAVLLHSLWRKTKRLSHVQQRSQTCHQGRPQNAMQTTIQLLFLAISDLSIGFSYVIYTIMFKTFEADGFWSGRMGCVASYALPGVFGINRWLTLYITFFRGRIVSGIRGAQSAVYKPKSRIIVETLIFGIGLGAFVSYAPYGFILYDLTYPFLISFSVYFVLHVIAMGCLGVYIVFKTARQNRTNGIRRLSTQSDHMVEIQRLVVAVAAVYCFSHACVVAETMLRIPAYYYDSKMCAESEIDHLNDVNLTLLLLNSTINFFIYWIISKCFRRECHRFWKLISP